MEKNDSLKNVLLKECLILLKQKTLKDLSLREIARRAGVSHNAPYRHFKNKEDLIQELVLEGFKGLTEAIDQRVPCPYSDIYSNLLECGVAYLDFGLNHPEYLKLIFSRDVYCHMVEKHHQESYDAFGRIVQIVQSGIDNGQLLSSVNAKILALNSWAYVHGLAHIVLAEQIPTQFQNFESILPLIEENVKAVLFGAANSDYKKNKKS